MLVHRPPIIPAFLVSLLFLLPASTTAIRLPFFNDLSLPYNFGSAHSGGPGPGIAPPKAGPTPLSSLPGQTRKSHAAQVNKRQRPKGPPLVSHSSSPGTSNPLQDQTFAGPAKRETNAIPDTWFIQRAYQGQHFFDSWMFATYDDPTHGQVKYISKEFAEQNNMSYVNSEGQAIMRVDNWSTLAPGQARNSIRIESMDVFNKGLFILDVEQAPWGCGVWPAWWTVGANWPWQGEIDILEGVHDNVHNQVTFHTGDNCTLVPPSAKSPLSHNFTGEVATTDCYAYRDASNLGCAVIDPSVASYGTQFNVLKGGVFAMMWLDNSIQVWFFHRAAIPLDIQSSSPKPSTWGTPTTFLGNGCDIPSHFSDHQLVFDITFCGDWAGSSYIDSGCPGTCSERVQHPENFANASWTINYVHVFGSPQIGGNRISAASPQFSISQHGSRALYAIATLAAVFSALTLCS